MHQIAGDHRPLAFGLDANADVGGGVARSRLEPDFVGDAVVRLDKLGQTRIDDRPHGVAQDVVGFAIAVSGLHPRLSVPPVFRCRSTRQHEQLQWGRDPPLEY